MFHARLNKLWPTCGAAVRACLRVLRRRARRFVHPSHFKSSDNCRVPQHLEQPPCSTLSASTRSLKIVENGVAWKGGG